MTVPIELNQEMRDIFQEFYLPKNPKSLETALIMLKKRGYSQLQSVFLIVESLQLSFAEANRIILNSEAWNS